MIIYKVTNKTNGMVYIGQTTAPLHKRWYQHCHRSSGCRYLHHAILAYGADNFTVEQIDTACNRVELNEKERFWIQHHNCIAPNGYNLKSGGNAPIYSKISRQRMSIHHADVSGANNPRYGVHLSVDIRQKIRNSQIGKRLSDEHKRKCCLNNPKRKAVKNIDTGEHFPSSRMAEKHYGLAHGTVSRVCRGEGNTAGGYRWSYVKGGGSHV